MCLQYFVQGCDVLIEKADKVEKWEDTASIVKVFEDNIKI